MCSQVTQTKKNIASTFLFVLNNLTVGIRLKRKEKWLGLQVVNFHKAYP